ncbi:transcription-repair coupling factor [Marinobacterium rhizophilum]|uniref:Transcription-repair-coupling factor n=1 Tax=Marinobacterium rhizophilum TaxID=420402 RepID=A0ABY5HMK9_9GAMM|nr:transcription-repair coupling factor [Marinobacterium rhizophilum]UTW13651.1 transcription-repair coupling factor [Marinobacterium rhizophilum]
MIKLDHPMPAGAGDIKRIGQLKGSAQGYLAAAAARRHQDVTLVVASSSDAAARLAGEIAFFDPDVELLSFPDWETLPYDNFSPHQDIISERILSLYRLPQLSRGILIVTAATLMQRIAPRKFIGGNSLLLDTGQRLDPSETRQMLSDAGYRAVETVYEHGEFAQRGAILDIYPMGSRLPYRIDLFDDEIDTLRVFDPETQRSIEQVEQVRLLPAQEFPFDSSAITAFRQRWRERFDVDPGRCPTYQDVSNGVTPPGIEYYLPLFFDSSMTLFDYLPDNTLVICDPGLEGAADHFWHEAQSRYEERRHDVERPLLAPEEVFTRVDELFAALKRFPRLVMHSDSAGKNAGAQDSAFDEPPALPVNAQSNHPMAALSDFLQSHPEPILFCAESAGRRESLLELFAAANIKTRSVDNWQAFAEQQPRHGICVYPLELGLSLPGQCQLITETQLFGQQVFQRRRRSRDKEQADQVIKNLSELRTGAPVVHLDHGVGRYLGLQCIELDGQQNEFLTLEYADNAKLYVPVSALHLISRYGGSSDEMAPLHRLGTEQWSRAKRKAAEKVRDTAAELLDIYARRGAREGFSFGTPDAEYRQFSASFPFEETPDQALAIEAVVKDMTATQPMDRLVCGDVGFGKTEVAMRAAFLAVQNSKQVVILVPTTLLAQQHYDNFRDRFADWPVNVELISRFRSASQQSQAQARLASGEIDIIVGTHKLLQGDIQFKDLGLVIIDEEHRFGVQQKERLKSLRAQVDILTLTATPIPRTLNMAMSGMRDLSIIATAPARRLSVKTFVRESDKPMIKEAILRELLRGGQVYYLHNEVKTIEKTADEIRALVPEARIGIGHGQLRERELEKVMTDFYHKRNNVLVCTTIIETGIDIPNANTIIIDRADKFGLAQLHQLRGRVGRSHHQAYAYLLTPPVANMTTDAGKRLEAIAQASDLGAGFTLATHDLEIRGAGELLGEDQSGQMQSVGFTLYMEMLEQAIQSLRDGKTPNPDAPLQHGPEINLRLQALIPDDYLPDVHNRLILYKRISNASNDAQLHELQVEMIDRFGLLPEPVKSLFRITALKLRASALGIAKVDAGDKGGRIEFNADTTIDPYKLVSLVQSQPRRFKLEGASQLRFIVEMTTPELRAQTVEHLLSELSA